VYFQPALYVMDLQLEPEVQRRGLGRHLMRTLELIARKQGMMHLMMPVVMKDEAAKQFALSLNGFKLDDLSEVKSYDGQDAAALLQEDGTFCILSKVLPQNPAVAQEVSTPAKKGSREPTDGELSAATTPEKDEAGAAGSFGFGASPSAPPAPSFDPTFGAAPAADGCDAAADALLAELVSTGVIPKSMGSEAKTLLHGLMLQYEQVHGRAPNGDDVSKWLNKLALHANQDASHCVEDESDEEEEEEEEEDDDEDEDE